MTFSSIPPLPQWKGNSTSKVAVHDQKSSQAWCLRRMPRNWGSEVEVLGMSMFASLRILNICCIFFIFFHGGVDWQFLADEIHGLPSSGALPCEGVTTFKATRQRSRLLESQPGFGYQTNPCPTKSATSSPGEACVHGDAHLGNIMWHHGQLRLIDFDMTSVGPVGTVPWLCQIRGHHSCSM